MLHRINVYPFVVVLVVATALLTTVPGSFAQDTPPADAPAAEPEVQPEPEQQPQPEEPGRDPGEVVTGTDPSSAMKIQISGAIDLHYVHRSGSINEAAALINGMVPATVKDTNFWAGRVNLRADITLDDQISGVVELENRDFDEGENAPFSLPDESGDDVNLEQAYIEGAEFLTPGLSFRIGVQDFAWHTRANDEPFFIDLGEAEGFYSGFQTVAGGFVNNSVDRDVREATGVRLTYVCQAGEIPMQFDLFAAVYGEGGPSSEDESVYALFVSGDPMPDLSTWGMLCLVSGPGEKAEVWTVGAGADYFYGENRMLEVFGELYYQFGSVLDDDEVFVLDKKAYALQIGGRLNLPWEEVEGLWVEGAVSYRSGNRDSDDAKGEDQSFQSYENENRFLVMQSAEFGFDVDTNIRVLRGTAGYGPIMIAERPLHLQLDVGHFVPAEKVRAVSGATFDLDPDEEDYWGTETDLSARWSASTSLMFWIQGAYLTHSGVIWDVTAEDEANAFVAAAGASLKF